MSENRPSPMLDSRGLAKNRIEALADGIFAVAMTPYDALAVPAGEVTVSVEAPVPPGERASEAAE